MRFALLIAVCVVSTANVFAGLAKLTIQLQDAETGLVPTNVVEGNVRFEFANKLGFLGSRNTYSEKRPDKDGRVTIWGMTELGNIGFQYCSIEYWHSWGEYEFTNSTLGVWWPMNPTIVFKVHPVGKGVRLFINEMRKGKEEDFLRKRGGKVAYDMLLCDWLPPVGTGVVADIECELRPQQRINDHCVRQELVYRFPGDGNGIQTVEPFLEDSLKIREAPEDGYVHEYVTWREVDTGRIDSRSDHEPNLCFRIRTVKNENGEIVAAHYGKVYWGMRHTSLYNNPECMISSPYVFYFINMNSNDRFLQHKGMNLCPYYDRFIGTP